MRLRNRCYVGLLLVSVTGCKAKGLTRADQIKLGDGFAAKEDWINAGAAYDAATRNGPPDAALLAKAARADVRGGRFKEAADAAVKSADLQPKDIDAQMLAAQLMLNRQRFDEVVERMSELLRTNPNNVDALIELGNGTAHLRSAASAILQFVDAKDKEEFAGMAVKSHSGADPLHPGLTPKDDAAAEAVFRQALGADPKNPRAQLALANFLWWSGRADQAEEGLKRLADEHPEQRIANLGLGVHDRLNHRFDEAERYLKVAAKDDNLAGRNAPAREAGVDAGRTTASFDLVDLYVETKRDDEALAFLTSLLPAHPTLAGIRLAEVEFRTGKRDEAMKRLDAMLATKPPPPRAAVVKAQFLIAMKQPDKAVPLARAGVAADPKSEEPRVTLGQALFAEGDLENAFDEYKEAFHLNPLAAGTAKDLALVSLALGRGQDALAYAREAVRLNPSDRDAAVLPVKAFILAQEYTSAEAELRPLLSRDPRSADLLVQTGTIEAGRGNDEAARAAFAKALESSHDSVDATSGIVSLDLKQKHNAAARQRVDAALAGHPKDPGYLQLAARVYAVDNDAPRAQSALRQAVDLDPASLNAAVSLATSIGAKQPDEARRVLEQILERRPKAVTARYALAVLLEQMGKAEDAQKAYDALIADATRPEWATLRSRATNRRDALAEKTGK